MPWSAIAFGVVVIWLLVLLFALALCRAAATMERDERPERRPWTPPRRSTLVSVRRARRPT